MNRIAKVLAAFATLVLPAVALVAFEATPALAAGYDYLDPVQAW
jgi:hypothetical protein